MSFSGDVRRFTAEALERANLARQKIGIEMFRRVIYRSPVDTGRFRGNWQTSVNDYQRGTIERTDQSGRANAAGLGFGSSAAGDAEVVTLASGPGDTLYLVNGLPYAKRLEYEGWSGQAPRGMVRVTVREFKNVARKVAKDALK